MQAFGPIFARMLIQMNPTIIIITAAVTVPHLFVLVDLVILPRISKPKPKVRDRIVGLGAFQTSDRFLQAVLLDAVVEAFAA